MNEHPIENLMNTAMSNLKEMIDVNTIVGEAIETTNGTVIIPISKVSFGFAAGGSEFSGETVDAYEREGIDEAITYRLPFGGGSGAGVNIVPVGFVLVKEVTFNCLPKVGCIMKLPVKETVSPAVIPGITPTAVNSSSSLEKSSTVKPFAAF